MRFNRIPKKRIISLLIIVAIILSSIFTTVAITGAASVVNNNDLTVNFANYSVTAIGKTMQKGNVRNNAGDFTVVSDSACSGGKALKFTRTPSKSAKSSLQYAFLLNPTGSFAQTGAIMLKPSTTYKLKIRYKITGISDNQIYQLRLYNTNDNKYDVASLNANVMSVVFASTGPQNDFIEATYEFVSPTCGANGYNLAASIAPYSSTTATSDIVATVNTAWSYQIDYINIVAADIYDTFDFSSYNADLTVNGKTVNTTCGAFSVEADTNAQGGKYLKYLRNSSAQVAGYNDPANYAFLINRWGEPSKQYAYSLKSSTEYSMTVKYRISNPNADEANQIWQFRLYNTASDKYDASSIDTSSAVKVFETKGNTDGFITKVYNFTSPASTSGNVNLIGCFVPTTDSTVTSSNNVAGIANYEINIDSIVFGEPAEIPPDENEPDGIHTIDFNKYFVKTDSANMQASVRTEAGKYSIEKDPECSNGSYLKFKRNDAKASQSKCDGRAVYMMQLNKTGGYTKESATILTPGTIYEFTIRYRMIDFPDDTNYQFGIYNAAGYTLSNWSGNDGKGIENRRTVFAAMGSTDGWVTETYYFEAPAAGAASYGLIGGFYPTSTASQDNNAAKLVYEYECDIDYIDIKECENQGQLPSFLQYPLPEKYLKTLDASEVSNIVFTGKDNNFWSNQFNDTSVPRAISFSWMGVEKKDPLYQKFQKINTIRMIDDSDTTGFYKNPKNANFMTAFVAGIIDISDYINTGYLRFWVKVARDTDVKIALTDESYAVAYYNMTFKKVSENDGYYEVSIPLRKFYDDAVASGVKWNHAHIRCIQILPAEATADGFMRNDEEMTFSPWQIWSKEPQNTSVDINRYFYAQLGCEMKIRDENDVMSKSTTLKAYRNTLEEEKAKKTVLGTYSDASFKELWSIYAMDTTDTDSRFQQPYEPVDLMIPKTGIFATKGLVAALVKEDGKVKTIPAKTEGNYIVLKIEEFGEIAFFTSSKAAASAALASSVSGTGFSVLNASSGSESGISTFVNSLALNAGNIQNVIIIWALAVMLIFAAVALLSSSNVSAKRFALNAMSIALCVCMVGITLCGCGKSNASSKKKKKKIVKRHIIVAQNDEEEEEDDSYYFDDNDEDDTDYEEIEEDTKTPAKTDDNMLELRILDDHPGIPGYDAEYEFRALYGPDMDMNIISKDEYTLSCSVPEVKIKGNKIIVPDSFRKSTKLKGFKVYATYNADKTKKAFFPMNVVKWNMTFNDEFDGKTLDMTKWSDETDIYVDPKKMDMYNGTTNVRLTDFCYIKDGNFVMPIVKNTENKSWKFNFGGNDKIAFSPTYVSSEIRTENTFGQKYGCFSVRKKDPGSNYVKSGTNSCFWMMPKNGSWGKNFMFTYTSGPNAGYSCGEIDVIERSCYWGKGEWQNTLHVWDSITGAKKDSGGNLVKVYNDELLTGEYIEYTTAWTRNALHTYANGKLVRSEHCIEEADSEAFIIISNNLNSMNPDKPAWTGYATEEDFDKLTVYVDYVRIYQAN